MESALLPRYLDYLASLAGTSRGEGHKLLDAFRQYQQQREQEEHKHLDALLRYMNRSYDPYEFDRRTLPFIDTVASAERRADEAFRRWISRR